MRLTITGKIPGKKNMYRRSKNGGMFRNEDLKHQIDSICWQIRSQIVPGKPFTKPRITAHFVCSSGIGDLDNKWTCIQDCLVTVGLLKNDNLKNLCGPITFSGEIKRKQDYAVIEIT